jgi:hypothetical protein
VKQLRNDFKTSDRRSFIKNGLVAAGAATMGVGLLANDSSVFAQNQGRGKGSGELTQGDAAILRFLAAAEIIETDFWVQYNELGGIQDKEVQGGTGNKPYTAALKVLDGDMDQYIHDNTEDEFTHQNFINAYLASKGADTVDLSQFVTLAGSTATGSSGRLRLTNLMQLTVDTSWWTRYRSRNKNPDLDPHFKFRQAVPGLSMGQFPAIPRSDADLHPKKHLQAIANTAAFHFPTIEQGGTSLYPALAQSVSDPEVLRILLSIGPTETAHFQTWHDKAGNAPPLTDPTNGLVFPDLNKHPFGGQDFKTNLIMPEPCPFLSRNLPVCSIIRPTETRGIAMGVVKFLTAMGLFIGQSSEFFKVLTDLAEEADEARREDKR